MELRRLEALQNLSHGTTKVIFDLAKPYADVHAAAGVAAAVASGEARNVRVSKGERSEEGAADESGEQSAAAARSRP
jgi:hypothetical protein